MISCSVNLIHTSKHIVSWLNIRHATSSNVKKKEGWINDGYIWISHSFNQRDTPAVGRLDGYKPLCVIVSDIYSIVFTTDVPSGLISCLDYCLIHMLASYMHPNCVKSVDLTVMWCYVSMCKTIVPVLGSHRRRAKSLLLRTYLASFTLVIDAHGR